MLLRLCIAACLALLFRRLGSRDRARANASAGCLQRLWPQTSPRGCAGQEHRTDTPVPHPQCAPQTPGPRAQHPGRENPLKMRDLRV